MAPCSLASLQLPACRLDSKSTSGAQMPLRLKLRISKQDVFNVTGWECSMEAKYLQDKKVPLSTDGLRFFLYKECINDSQEDFACSGRDETRTSRQPS